MPHSIYAHMNMHAFGEVPTPPIACSVPGWHLAQLSLSRWSTEPSRRPGQGSRLVPRTKPRCPVALRGGEDILQTHPPCTVSLARRAAPCCSERYAILRCINVQEPRPNSSWLQERDKALSTARVWIDVCLTNIRQTPSPWQLFAETCARRRYSANACYTFSSHRE